MANVKLRVERLVADPVGKIGVERNFDQALPQAWCKVGALSDRLDDALKADDSTRGSGGIKNSHRADMHRRIRCLEEQKGCV
jgi:hypothetical protein